MGSISRRPIEFLAIVLFFQIIMDITIILNIPVARQVMGFVYFTFVPGLLIVKIMRMNQLNFLETILFSAGFSLAFLLLFGLSINFILPLINIARPLSVIPLTVMFNGAVVIGSVVAFLRNAEVPIFNFKFLKRHLLILPLICLPILSVAGAIFSNVYGNNLILLIMIFLISAIFVILTLFKKLPFSNYYPLIIFVIAISLLLQFSLVSNYVHGNDTPAEYFVMSNTQTNSIWNQTGPYPNNEYWGRLNSMLSITILPTIYSSVLNLNLTSTYMIIFPLLFCLVPLVLFQTWRKYIGSKYAFIASFVFIAEPTFFTEMLGLTRQMIAEIFFVLLIFILLKKNMKKIDRLFCFALFSFGLVVSHYALAEIFLFFIFLTFAVNVLLQHFSRKLNINISLNLVLLFFVIMFSWYVFTSSSSVFDSFLTFGQSVLNQLGDFANPASRGQTVLMGLGLTAPPTIWNSISRVFAYFIEAFIVIGFVGLILKRVRNNYDRTYALLTTFSVILLAALIVVPGLAATMNMSRFYHILLFFLAPLCVLGAGFISKLVFKRKKQILSMLLLATVLTAYFLFQTGIVYELTGSLSYSLPLNVNKFGSRLSNDYGILTEQDVTSAQWLSQHDNGGSSQVYAGYLTPLIGYGAFNFPRLSALSNITETKAGDFVYLGTLNNRYGLVFGNDVWNTSDIQQSVFPLSSKIYSSNECEIYKLTNNP